MGLDRATRRRFRRNLMRSETVLREIAYTRQLTPTPRDPHAKSTPNLKGHLGSPRGLYTPLY